MNVRAIPITLTQTAAGAGTVISPYPVAGEVVEVRLPIGGTVISDGTADFTITKLYDGGTVLNVSNQTAPWEYFPRRAVHSTAGGTTAYGTAHAVYDTGGGVPVDGYLQVVWAQGAAAAATATLWVHVRES